MVGGGWLSGALVLYPLLDFWVLIPSLQRSVVEAAAA